MKEVDEKMITIEFWKFYFADVRNCIATGDAIDEFAEVFMSLLGVLFTPFLLVIDLIMLPLELFVIIKRTIRKRKERVKCEPFELTKDIVKEWRVEK